MSSSAIPFAIRADERGIEDVVVGGDLGDREGRATGEPSL